MSMRGLDAAGRLSFGAERFIVFVCIYVFGFLLMLVHSDLFSIF